MKKLINERFCFTNSIDELKECDIYWVGERRTAISEQLHDLGRMRLKGDYTKTFNKSLKGECLYIRMNVVDNRSW